MAIFIRTAYIKYSLGPYKGTFALWQVLRFCHIELNRKKKVVYLATPLIIITTHWFNSYIDLTVSNFNTPMRPILELTMSVIREKQNGQRWLLSFLHCKTFFEFRVPHFGFELVISSLQRERKCQFWVFVRVALKRWNLVNLHYNSPCQLPHARSKIP